MANRPLLTDHQGRIYETDEPYVERIPPMKFLKVHILQRTDPISVSATPQKEPWEHAKRIGQEGIVDHENHIYYPPAAIERIHVVVKPGSIGYRERDPETGQYRYVVKELDEYGNPKS